MTKYFKYCLENHGGGRRVAEAKSSDPATPQNLERAPTPDIYQFLRKLCKNPNCNISCPELGFCSSKHIVV